MKTKKRTRAQILERLHEISYDTEAVKKYVEFDEPHKYIAITNILHKGEAMTEAHCRNCGEKYIKTPIWGGRYMRPKRVEHFKCPNCGNEHLVEDRAEKLEEKKHRLIVKAEDGFEFVRFASYMIHDDRDDWREYEPHRHIEITAAGIFDRNSGFYISTRSGRNGYQYKVLRRLSSDERSAIFWLKDFTDSNVSEEECQELLKEANEHYQKQQKDSEARSAARRNKKEEKERIEREEREKAAERKRQEYEAMRLADKRWTYEARPVDVESVFSHPIFHSLYSYDSAGNETYIVGCAKCGAVEEVAGINTESEYICPHCGNHVDALAESYGRYSGDYNQTAIVFENTEFEENDLLIRVFNYRCGMDRDRNITKDVYESKRIFAGDEPNIYWRRSAKDNLEKANDMDNFYVHHGDGVALNQSDQEIAEIVKRSCLKYSGLLDAWGIGKFNYNWNTHIPNLNYLKAWYVNPAIEIVMKSNLTHITDWLIDNPEYMREGKTLAEVLGISPGIVKTIVKMNPHPRAMDDIATLYRSDNTITVDVYNQIAQEDLNRTTLRNIVERHGITYDKILKYLQAAYDHQCILKRETLSIWSDYLRMASAVGVNLSDKAKKFPASLKKEHDIVMFAYRAVQVEMDKKVFAEQAELNAKYEFETDDMFVIVPKTPQEVIEEANHQNNCLRSYVERVKRGETVVVFVRRKSEPEKTFLSAEILDGELVQLKGWCNSDPRTKEIVEFTKKWAEACDIVIKC